MIKFNLNHLKMQTTTTKKGFTPKFSWEERRRQFANRIAEEIRNDNATIKMHKRTIENFETRGGGDKEYNECRIQKCESQIVYLIDKIATAQVKLDGVMAGNCDEEIEASYREIRDEIKKKDEDAKRKQALDLEQNAASRTDGNVFYKAERSENSKEKSMQNHLKKFIDVCETLPPHMARKIDTTPCNRGYKWRGVIFYGKLPEQLPDMIFEKRDGGTFIREITPTSQVVYFKDDANKQKRNVSSVKRKLQPGLRGPATVY
jgi:hypothetical protein